MSSNEELLELSDITLIPSPLSRCSRNINYLVKDTISRSLPDSLPLFTSPMGSVVDDKNWRVWENSKINTIIPRTVDLETRINLSQYIFTGFSLQEIKKEFIEQDKRFLNQFKICIDVENGHHNLVLDFGNRLRKIYNNQVILMGGNIDNPEAFVEYSRAGFDFVRIGMTSGSLVMREKFGYHYPMASLIMDTCKVRNKAKSVGIRPIGIIADGGIESHVDIIKSIALGADYVMIGREFSKILEAAGTVYSKRRTPEGFETMEEVLKSADLTEKELKELSLIRLYSGNSIEACRDRNDFIDPYKIVDAKSIWIKVDKRLDTWLSDFKDNINYSFLLSDSENWNEYKQKVRYGRL